MSKEWFYFDPNGVKEGPISQAKMIELVNAGIIRKDTILEVGGKQTPAGFVKGIEFPEIKPQPEVPIAPVEAVNPFTETGEPLPDFTPEPRSSNAKSFGAVIASTKPYLAFVNTVLLALILLFVVAQTTTNKMKRYEYQIISHHDLLVEDELDKYGKDGWQVVSARRATSDYGPASYEMIFMLQSH